MSRLSRLLFGTLSLLRIYQMENGKKRRDGERASRDWTDI